MKTTPVHPQPRKEVRGRRHLLMAGTSPLRTFIYPNEQQPNSWSFYQDVCGCGTWGLINVPFKAPSFQHGQLFPRENNLSSKSFCFFLAGFQPMESSSASGFDPEPKGRIQARRDPRDPASPPASQGARQEVPAQTKAPAPGCEGSEEFSVLGVYAGRTV